MSRAADVAIAGVLLVLVAPLLAVVSCAILLTSGRPVVYRGPRVGRDGRPFHILKLRTMRPDSDAGRHVTVAGDDRVTRVGRLLRLTKLDELPQLVNVLRGDMALVGPRPESPRYVARYTPEQRAVLSVRPGITGAAQVAYSQEERLLAGPDPEAVYLGAIMPDKLAIDLAYVRRRSAWLDLRLIALTLVAVFRPVRSPLEAPPAAGEARPGLPLPAALSSAAIDLVVVAAAYEAATVLRFVDSPDLAGELAGLLGPCVAAGAASAAVFAALGLHRRG